MATESALPEPVPSPAGFVSELELSHRALQPAEDDMTLLVAKRL